MRFDPFSDRTARDIRNSLSSALVSELTAAGGPSVDDVAEEWLARKPEKAYRTYIESCRCRYREVLTRMQAESIKAPQHQTIVLWNAGLYFELHELLETMWHGALEPERTGLKGLIQAAGAYLHSRRGRAETGQKLALRARKHLQAGAAALPFIANLTRLIEALADSPPTPLKLVYQPLAGFSDVGSNFCAGAE